MSWYPMTPFDSGKTSAVGGTASGQSAAPGSSSRRCRTGSRPCSVSLPAGPLVLRVEGVHPHARVGLVRTQILRDLVRHAVVEAVGQIVVVGGGPAHDPVERTDITGLHVVGAGDICAPTRSTGSAPCSPCSSSARDRPGPGCCRCRDTRPCTVRLRESDRDCCPAARGRSSSVGTCRGPPRAGAGSSSSTSTGAVRKRTVTVRRQIVPVSGAPAVGPVIPPIWGRSLNLKTPGSQNMFNLSRGRDLRRQAQSRPDRAR